MTLDDLIKRLSKLDAGFVASNGFGEGMSYRGYYEQLAFEPKDNAKVEDMLAEAKACVDKSFYGYKGGSYRMGLHTTVNACYRGAFNWDEGESMERLIDGIELEAAQAEQHGN